MRNRLSTIAIVNGHDVVCPSGPPMLSIVIVSWRSRVVLLDCLASLRENPPSCPWEVIVVDNASGDGTVAALAAQRDVRVIANRVNRGLSAANNQGLFAATGQFVVISNPDVLFTERAVDRLLDVFERHPRAAIAVPRLRQIDGALQASVGDLPTLPEALLGSAWRRHKEGRAFWWTDWSHEREVRIGHGSEACYAVRQQAIVEIGPQDERFPLDWEGIDWSARAADTGWEIWFTPDSEFVHIGGVSIRQARSRWILRSHLGLYRYFSRRVVLPARAPLGAVVFLRAVIKIILMCFKFPLYERARRSARAVARITAVDG